MKNNLKFINKDEKWLKKELKVKGYKDLKNILLATVDNNEKLLVYERNENVPNYEILE